jgi:aspartyl-tRNA(Asn)/glutamyl-tRNA(Gln) amidotransferase subunit A
VTIGQTARALAERKVSSEELTRAALERVEALNPKLNAFITVTGDEAIADAKRADSEIAEKRYRGPLHGIPIAVKDLFYTRGVRTTGGSPILGDFVPSYDAAVMERLSAAGAVNVGKLNQHELAYGITSENPHFGPVRNPWNTAHSPGGSSGGSGAAVAAGIVYMAMGTDTGGSIRIPAAWCGTVGLKPTYGRVSRYGVLPLGFSLDHMGPLTHTVRDAGVVLNAIAGHDRRDPYSSRRPTVDYVPDEGCSMVGLRVGFAENFFFEHLDGDVETAVRGAIARAQALGAQVLQVRVPDVEALNAVGRVILLAEASAVWTPHLDKRNKFGEDVLTLLDQGRLVPAPDYVNAQRLRRKLRREFDRLWKDVDCLLLPATATPAPKIGQKTVRLGDREEDVRLATTRLLRGINVLGYPALSLPCGLSGSGLPIGLQIVGPAFDEATVLKVGAALEDSGIGIPPCPMR